MKKLMLFVLTFLAFAGCSDDDDLTPAQQLLADIEEIQNYLNEKGLQADTLASGLHYIIEKPGSGGAPDINNTVTVKYTGYFTDERIFDQTQPGQSISFPLQNVILGWQEGIPLFEKGGKGTLLLPSILGYGSNPPPGIPENSVLIFDVELVDFQ